MTTSHTLTGDLRDLGLEDPNAQVWLGTNLGPNDALVDLDNNLIALRGRKRIPLTGTAFSVDLIATNSTGTNIGDGSLRYIVYVEHRSAGPRPSRETWNSGYFELTGNLDLSDAVGMAYLEPTFTVNADDIVSGLIETPGSAVETALSGQFVAPSGKTTAGPAAPQEHRNVKNYGAKGDGIANDTVAINAALAAMSPGDTLLFPPGRYMTDGGHVISAPSVRIAGAGGRAQTYNSSAQLYLRDGANADMLTIAANQVTLRDLTLHGQYSGQTGPSRGLVINTNCNYFLIDAVWVTSFNGDGFVIGSGGSGTQSGTVHNSEFRMNQGYGVNCTATATDAMFSNCYIDQNALSGVLCSAGDQSFMQCHIWGNGTGASGDRDGMTFKSAAGCRIINCYIETNQNGAGIGFRSGGNQGHVIQGCDIWNNGFQGIYMFSASNAVISGNVIRHNNFKSGTSASGAGIAVDSCTALAITGNNLFSTGTLRQTFGYYETGTNNAACLFSGNVCRAAQHLSGSTVIAAGTAIPTTVGTNVT